LQARSVARHGHGVVVWTLVWSRLVSWREGRRPAAVVPVIATATRTRSRGRGAGGSYGVSRPHLDPACAGARRFRSGPPRTVAVAASVPCLAVAVAVGGLPPVGCGGVCGATGPGQSKAGSTQQLSLCGHSRTFGTGLASRGADPQAALAEEKNSNALLLSAFPLPPPLLSPLPSSSFSSAPAICRRSRSQLFTAAGTLDPTFSLITVTSLYFPFKRKVHTAHRTRLKVKGLGIGELHVTVACPARSPSLRKIPLKKRSDRSHKDETI